jgi:hypothetical protein
VPSPPAAAVALGTPAREHSYNTFAGALGILPTMVQTSRSSTVVDLSTHRLQFETGGNVHPTERRPAVGDEDWSLGVYHAETNDDVHSGHWEQHPRGDEAVCCIRGAVTLFLRPSEPDETTDDVVRLLPGQAAIVPRGRWHRQEVDEPTDLVVVTLPHGTQLEKVEQLLAGNKAA